MGRASGATGLDGSFGLVSMYLGPRRVRLAVTTC